MGSLCPTFCDLWSVALQAPLWDFSGKKTGVSCHFLLQGVFPTQGLNPNLMRLLALADGFFPTEPPGKPRQIVRVLQKNALGRKSKNMQQELWELKTKNGGPGWTGRWGGRKDPQVHRDCS